MQRQYPDGEHEAEGGGTPAVQDADSDADRRSQERHTEKCRPEGVPGEPPGDKRRVECETDEMVEAKDEERKSEDVTGGVGEPCGDGSRGGDEQGKGGDGDGLEKYGARGNAGEMLEKDRSDDNESAEGEERAEDDGGGSGGARREDCCTTGDPYRAGQIGEPGNGGQPGDEIERVVGAAEGMSDGVGAEPGFDADGDDGDGEDETAGGGESAEEADERRGRRRNREGHENPFCLRAFWIATEPRTAGCCDAGGEKEGVRARGGQDGTRPGDETGSARSFGGTAGFAICRGRGVC